jgi:hypothetical protein
MTNRGSPREQICPHTHVESSEMIDLMYRDMLEATRLTRAGQLVGATKLLQRALTKNGSPHSARDANRPHVGRIPHSIDITPDKVEVMDIQSSAECAPASMT